MFRQLKELLSSSVFVFSFFLASNLTLAHSDSIITGKKNSSQNDEFASKHAKALQNRLDLLNDQTTQIANILHKYRNNVFNTNQDNPSIDNSIVPQQIVNDIITALLDENLKAAFTKIQKDWWTNVNQDIGILSDRH